MHDSLYSYTVNIAKHYQNSAKDENFFEINRVFGKGITLLIAFISKLQDYIHQYET